MNFALTLLSLALLGLASGTPDRRLRQLALAAGVLFTGMPMVSWLMPGLTQVGAIQISSLEQMSSLEHLMICLGGYVVLQALRSRRPAWGLCGALAAAVAAAFSATPFSAAPFSAAILSAGGVAIGVGFAFLLLHSLCWEAHGWISKGVVGLRIGTAVSWMTHAFVWTRVDGGVGLWMIPSAAVLILFTGLALCVSTLYVSTLPLRSISDLLGVVTGQWGARVVPAGAVLSFLAAPANFLIAD